MRVVVVGYGHAERGEDAAGLLVVEALKKSAIEDVETRATTGDPRRVVEAWDCSETAIVVDAVDTGRIPGTIFRLAGNRSVRDALALLTSPHSLGLLEAFERGCLLGRMPSRVIFYGIEAHNFAPGAEIGAEVREAIDVVVKRVIQDVRALRSSTAANPQ